jgi:hypothetical protein
MRRGVHCAGGSVLRVDEVVAVSVCEEIMGSVGTIGCMAGLGGPLQVGPLIPGRLPQDPLRRSRDSPVAVMQ